MGSVVFVFRWYLVGYCSFLLGRNNKYAIAFRHLIHQKTHRLPKGLHRNVRTAVAILYRRILADLFRKGHVPFNVDGDVVFYNESAEPWAIQYIENNNEKVALAAYLTPYTVLFRAGWLVKLLYSLCIFTVGIVSLPLCLIRPIGIWALHLTILHEHIKIITEIRGKKIKHFFDFISYEIGSSFLTILMGKKGIRNYCITSPTPLYETYPDCVVDVFLSTSPYHKDEIRYSRSNIQYPLRFVYNEFREWPYNEFDDQLELNDGRDYNNRKKLGLYVSGVWWRSKEKHQEFADGFFESEFLLLQHAKQFMEAHPEFELWLFLHPRERRTKEQLQEALAFYKGVFGEVSFQLMDFSKPTKAQFGLCDISISVSSNTTYERLFGGFKSIFAPYYLPNFPIPGNALENICIRSYESLEKRIMEFDAIDTESFFETTGLRLYHHKYRKFSNQGVEI